MKKISGVQFRRMTGSLVEALAQDDQELSSKLSYQISKAGVRNPDEPHQHTYPELQDTVDNLIWTGIVQASDYFGINPEAEEVNSLVIESRDLLLGKFAKIFKTPIIGPHEAKLAGQDGAEVFDLDVELEVE